MLKTNSKKARENIREYIMRGFDGTNYGIETPETFTAAAKIIMDTFRSEKYCGNEIKHYRGIEYNAFVDWAQGLPSIIDTCYYYNRSAVDDAAAILDENESEKARYDERRAESLLTYMIYRELCYATQK